MKGAITPSMNQDRCLISRKLEESLRERQKEGFLIRQTSNLIPFSMWISHMVNSSYHMYSSYPTQNPKIFAKKEEHLQKSLT
jgi:hypothetical protein